MNSFEHKLPADTTEVALLWLIEQLTRHTGPATPARPYRRVQDHQRSQS
jgi:hypothetical protein